MEFFFIQCRLIVSQMSNTRCEILPWILLPVSAAALLSQIAPNYDRETMYLLAIIAVGAHVHYGACIVSKLFVLINYLSHF